MGAEASQDLRSGRSFDISLSPQNVGILLAVFSKLKPMASLSFDPQLLSSGHLEERQTPPCQLLVLGWSGGHCYFPLAPLGVTLNRRVWTHLPGHLVLKPPFCFCLE